MYADAATASDVVKAQLEYIERMQREQANRLASSGRGPLGSFLCYSPQWNSVLLISMCRAAWDPSTFVKRI